MPTVARTVLRHNSRPFIPTSSFMSFGNLLNPCKFGHLAGSLCTILHHLVDLSKSIK